MALFSTTQDVESRLTQMGTSIDGLLSVVRAAGAALASTTNYHPKSAAGTYAYHEGTAALRRLLVPVGYSHDEEHNQPRTFSNERGVSIIVQGGDENTGKDTGIEPRNRNAHGGVTERKINQNAEQLLLPIFINRPSDTDLEATEAQPVLLTWILLIAVVHGELRAELSLPRGIEAGKVTSWVDRIVLPEQAFDGPELQDLNSDHDNEGPDDEVAVEWR